MDAKSAEVASEPLRYQTWFLKVSIHCEGCRRKVKKVLQTIDGVFTTTIDPQEQKVTVIGSVGVETLIRKLMKAGKHAEIWPENLPGKGENSGKGKKRNEQKDPESGETHSAEKSESQPISEKNTGAESAANCNGDSKHSDSKVGGNSQDKSPSDDHHTAGDQKGGQGDGAAGKSGGGGSGKKKKKAQSGGRNGSNGLGAAYGMTPAHTGLQSSGQVVGTEMGQMNPSPTRQQPYPYPYPYTETYDPPMVNLAAYNRLHPMGRMGGPSYYVLPSSYTCAGLGQGINHLQSAPLVPFEIFSDENANGCSIM